MTNGQYFRGGEINIIYKPLRSARNLIEIDASALQKSETYKIFVLI